MPESTDGQVVQGSDQGALQASEGSTVSVWHWYSLDQAAAATVFVSRCADLEQNSPEPTEDERQRLGWSEAAARDHRASAIAAITSSVAFLEASINEFYASAAYPELGLAGKLVERHRTALVATAEMLSRNSLLDRYQITLHLLESTPFDAGAQPFQDAKLVIQLRNELVHYSPGWRKPGDERKFERALQSKRRSVSPFTGAGNPFFPDKALSHGYAQWAWTAVLNFADEFFDRIGLEPVHRQFLATL